jgi:hypothetical protein
LDKHYEMAKSTNDKRNENPRQGVEEEIYGLVFEIYYQNYETRTATNENQRNFERNKMGKIGTDPPLYSLNHRC